jgi:NitT/TauT family transport system ATP-binding protein
MSALDSEMQNVHVRIRGLNRAFGGKKRAPAVHALGPLDLELHKGEFFSVVGPSGCGKSTLLDAMAGLSSIVEGSVQFEDKEVNGSVPPGVGVVFQEDSSFSWLNVYDNVAFGLRRAGLDAAEIKRRVDHAIGFVGLRDFVAAYPVQLSGGMRQRVCIARTLVMQPRLILLDEPFGALDQQTRLLMGDELLNLWRGTGATVMLITHALDEAAMLSDRVGVMSSRPGRFLEIIPTNWPRDRDSNIVAGPEFGNLTARLWSLLRQESLKAMGGRTLHRPYDATLDARESEKIRETKRVAP